MFNPFHSYTDIKMSINNFILLSLFWGVKMRPENALKMIAITNAGEFNTQYFCKYDEVIILPVLNNDYSDYNCKNCQNIFNY